MFKWLGARDDKPENVETNLIDLVRTTLPEADDGSVRVIAACAGLLAAVAYADRDYSKTESARVSTLLETINGIGEYGAGEIARVLELNARQISTVHMPHFCRTLVTLADRDLRLQVLDLLLDVAGADDQITHEEVIVLRGLTTSLGLEQADYNAAQAKHKHKLTALRGS